jgi:hypothetical protein
MKGIYEIIAFVKEKEMIEDKVVRSIENKRISFLSDNTAGGCCIIRSKGAVKERNKFYEVVDTIDTSEHIDDVELAKALENDCILVKPINYHRLKIAKETKELKSTQG